VALRSLSRVPPEVLGRIFQHNISPHHIQHGQYCRIFNFLFVCRRWYSVAQATPHLWCKLGNDVGLWPMFARLSKRLDLSIEMLDVLDEFNPLETLALHAIFRDAAFTDRIREFTFDGDDLILNTIYPSNIPPPSRLVSLSVINGFGMAIYSGIIKHLVGPSVKRLQIFPSGSELGGARNLTHLSLGSYNPPPSKCPELLSTLRLSPLLQHVSIRYTRTECPLGSGGEQEAISLPDLRTIEISTPWKVNQFHQFLERLKLSANLNEIKLGALHAQPEDSIHAFGGLFATLNSTISPGKIRHLVMQESDHVDRILHYRRHATNDPPLPRQAPLLILKSPKIPADSLGRDLLKLGETGILRDLLHLELELRIFRTRSYLEGILEMIPGLTKLTVWLRGTEASLFESIGPEMIKHPIDLDKATPLLPFLRDLVILDVFFSGPSLKETILSCCRSRKKCGFPFEKIRIAGCVGGDSPWVEGIREVVRNVDWDGAEEQSLGSLDGGATGTTSDSDEDPVYY